MYQTLDFVGGCFGGIAGVVVGHPLDTIKVRLQIQGGRQSVVNGMHAMKLETVPKHAYRSTWHCLTSIVKSEGFFGLFKGLASPMAGQAFLNTILFGVEANLQRQFNIDSVFSHYMSGAAAGAVQCVVASPMELAKVRVQLQGQGESHRYYKTHSHAYKGSLRCIYKICIDEGIRGCYRGMNSTLIRDVPGFAVYFGLDKSVCNYFQSRHPQNELNWPEMIISGGIAGTLSWVVSHPTDVIKSRIQADGVKGTPLYRGTIDCIRKSIKAEGYRVFLKGITANLLRAFPVNAAIFTVHKCFVGYCYKHFEFKHRNEF
ncbi:mitochondrial basic amino acids transporter-like [Saccoglossus kowalevskii]|uniref:Mitochondrial carnitine/acylcarnitine carrier protein CACL-like n=1 Tax=Saccoglossus kowalevskii TaxID=10224 RepID=A0ABM0GLK8_SACKO|nr:PREDICTED: mitochondrial carnitine/acylcarnitine carrier protein CACL-like [Saccoglossus kowalevskii]